MSLRDQLRSTLSAQLHVARTKGCNHETSGRPTISAAVGPSYGSITRKRIGGDLAKAIGEVCRARGIGKTECLALIEACLALKMSQQLDLLEHFLDEIRRA